mmetsp:Transcript_19703/g.54112  ORF Transcript_19703/g.54112 Transcript_19703/m.54112 type:complete len:257 (-) Transcript_19703:370-1140(-)
MAPPKIAGAPRKLGAKWARTLRRKRLVPANEHQFGDLGDMRPVVEAVVIHVLHTLRHRLPVGEVLSPMWLDELAATTDDALQAVQNGLPSLSIPNPMVVVHFHHRVRDLQWDRPRQKLQTWRRTGIPAHLADGEIVWVDTAANEVLPPLGGGCSILVRASFLCVRPSEDSLRRHGHGQPPTAWHFVAMGISQHDSHPLFRPQRHVQAEASRFPGTPCCVRKRLDRLRRRGPVDPPQPAELSGHMAAVGRLTVAACP